MATLSPELHPVPVKSPWYHVGIDFIGPIQISKQNNQLILTLSDYCTKYVDAIALSTKCVSVTAGAVHVQGILHSIIVLTLTINICNYS